MTPTEKQKCIAEQAVYGDLQVVPLEGFEPMLFKRGFSLPYHNGWQVERFMPVLRPLSDLTKEITHKGYNDNKPFIPLVELAKASVVQDGREPFDFKYDAEDNTVSYYKKPNKEMYVYYIEKPPFPLTTKETDLLHRWHFDTRNLIATGDAIDVNTLDINPYEV